MPKALKDWLKQLSDKEASRVWVWLDGTPGVASQMIEVIGNSHKELAYKLCGPYALDEIACFIPESEWKARRHKKK